VLLHLILLRVKQELQPVLKEMKMPTKREELTEVLEWPGVVEAARQIGISINRTYHLVWTNKIAAQKIAGHWRVSPEAIAVYSASRSSRCALSVAGAERQGAS
jgi:hypothetical protein